AVILMHKPYIWQGLIMRLTSAIIALSICVSTHAGVVQYTNKAAWQSAVGSYHTIDFTGFQHGMILSTQYQAEHGITFVGQQGFYHSSSMLNDGQGVVGIPGSRMFFDTPQKWIAVDFPGTIVFNLYFQGELIYTSSQFLDFPSPFAGLISDTPFDEVYLFRYTTSLVFYDDLYFGVPAPGALGVFALAALGCRRRRR
ncbi:MAG TPA: hypothetical protein PK098_02400, partial [Phycisphaerales bacterium]|nr:hypothetical protein [Phycisphaerales bacterium]